MPLKKVRFFDSLNRIKPYVEYYLCQDHADCYEYGFPQEAGGGCYYERISSKHPVLKSEADQESALASSAPRTTYDGDHEDDDGLDLMADKEKVKYIFVKVCKIRQDLKYSSASQRCLKDADCPPGFFCHDINFQCTFISHYGDRCGKAVRQSGSMGGDQRGDDDQTAAPVAVYVPERDIDLEDDTWDYDVLGRHGAAVKLADDVCPKGLFCHPEIQRCLSLHHSVLRDSSGRIRCRKYSDCPATHYCSLELQEHGPQDYGVCMEKLPIKKSCLDHRQCSFGHGCVEDVESFRISRCHKRCYTNYDCYPKGVCLPGNFTIASHLPSMGFCFGDRPVLYPEQQISVVESDLFYVVIGVAVIVGASILAIALAIFLYKRKKAKQST